MPTITTTDGTEIFYKDWGAGQPVVFSHGWPLNADAWDEQLALFASNGHRAIALDRRGHGRSAQTWQGNDMDHYADDLAALTAALDLKSAIHIGHSTGGGEVARYIGRHGTSRVAKVVLVGAVPPVMIQSATNPGGLPMSAFDGLRAGLAKDRAQFYRDLALPFYGYNRPGANVSQGVIDTFWLWSMQVGYAAAYDCVKAFSETDFTEDLKKMDVPVLFIAGEDDQIVPIADASELAVKIVKNATLKVYPGAPHGLFATHRDRFHEDLLAFAKS
ncbi:MAG TPA: alpha/beta hydrolase [Candidatus Binatia bacterium]|nr:alpha/beta hydrolase [Candidatus Binatia bacterium]